MSRYLVIGGSSFIGAYTVQALLDAGCEVDATGRNTAFNDHYRSLGVGYSFFDLGTDDPFAVLPDRDYDGIVLLAALLPANSSASLQDYDNAADYFTVNSAGTARLLEWARSKGAQRVISTTSYADVQRSWSGEMPIEEDWPRSFNFTGDHAAYVISKNAACDIMQYYNEQHGMHNVAFRLPPVYGVGPHNELFVNGVRRLSGIAMFIELAKRGEEITVFGDASLARDVVYVKDVAQAFVKALGSEQAEGLYNIGSGRSTSLMEQAQVIADVFSEDGKRSVVTLDASRPNGIQPYSMDIAKARLDFGYEPQFSDFSDMMRDWKLEEERDVYTELFSNNIERGH